MIRLRVPATLFHSTRIVASGHNKWSKIRHSKGAADAARAQLFSRLANDISVAARLAESDPTFSVKLTAAITAAKAASMPKVKIDNALKRGSPGSGKAAGEQITYEATMGSIGLIIETETDKKTRTIANVKTILKKGGATLSPCGFLFDRVGVIMIKSDKSFDDLFELIVDTDAEDLEVVDEAVYAVRTSPDNISEVVESLKELGLEVIEAESQYRAKEDNAKATSEEIRILIRDLVNNLEDDPDVTRVWTSAKTLD